MVAAVDTLTTRAYYLELRCPECHQTVTVAINLSTVLTIDSGADAPTLRPKMRAAKVDHDCAQLSLAM